MNYYERHLGDYAKDTPHLSMLEHGAYNLLLDRYYATEKGIPQDQVYRVTRARTAAERRAVDNVLREFFTSCEGVWTKNRCEVEISTAQTRIGSARENGKKGGRPKSQANQQSEKPDGINPVKGSVSLGLDLGSQNVTQLKALQSPVSNLHLPVRSKRGKAPHNVNGILVEALVPGVDLDAWDKWFAYRKSVGKPIKPASMEEAQKSLASFGADQLAVVTQSIANSWQGLFALKATKSANGSAYPARGGTTHAQVMAALDAATDPNSVEFP